MPSANRNYWVVSPNVNNDESTVGDWRRASVLGKVAFMGWSPDDEGHKQMGPKFAGNTANGIQPGDVVLIARRHRLNPEIVGFGQVVGKAMIRIPGSIIPRELRHRFGSARRLNPFVPWTGMPPQRVPIREVIKHTSALAQLHPDTNDAQRMVCEWLDDELNRHSRGKVSRRVSQLHIRQAVPAEIRIVESQQNHQLDYQVRTKARVLKAKKDEARLLESYRDWLARQGREISAARYGRLQCDAYESDRKNLVEAKPSARREHIRMAVGQLLDYSYQGRDEIGAVNMAILLPVEPEEEIKSWLNHLKIRTVWREKDVFLDNANGQFT